jgi:exoribonuclease-2
VSYVLFDEAGKFLAGRVMSQADTSLQVELDSGKRVKVKAANVLLRFDAPAPAELVAAAQRIAPEIELDLAWEFAPDGEFGYAELARDYFSAKAPVEQQAAMLWRLYEAPHYFRRVGKGQFKKAPQETVRAALLGIERKKQQAAQIDAWAAELAAGRCPAPIGEQLYRILFKPDKNAPEYKAVVEAARRTQRAPLDLLSAAGAITSPYEFHWRRFLVEHFPRGTTFPAGLAAPPPDAAELPLAEGVQAFSIDDSQTTEIDDALSVRGLGQGTVTLGIHIAAPGLAITPGSELDRIAAARLSTVYLPGGKITMLPDALVQAYTLTAGRACPALSLYLEFDEDTLELRRRTTRIERVAIVTNLRHDELDAQITAASLVGDAPADYPHAAELAFAFRLARHLKAEREQVRGRPENFTRPDYNFRLDGVADGALPDGSETVRIEARRRGAPLDLIVAEAMILANSHWGGWLAECGVPGIYRSQASLAPGVKVRMGTKPAPHAGIGVAQYAWSTSPLRRYVDLVNQWQLIACARHGHTAALAAPFKPKDAQLFSIVSAFDAAYAAYADFQHGMERYWTLRWLQQHAVSELDAAVMKDGLVRAETLPLVLRLPGSEGFARGSRVRLRIAGIDLLTLDVHATLVARLEDVPPAGSPAGDDDADEGEDDAAPLALAIDVAADEPAPAADAQQAAA